MGKLYYTKDVTKLMEDKIEELALEAALNDEVPMSSTVDRIRGVRMFRDFAAVVSEAMVAEDQRYDDEMARFKAEVEARKAAEKDDDDDA